MDLLKLLHWIMPSVNRSVDSTAVLELSLAVLRIKLRMSCDPVILFLDIYIKIVVKVFNVIRDVYMDVHCSIICSSRKMDAI